MPEKLLRKLGLQIWRLQPSCIKGIWLYVWSHMCWPNLIKNKYCMENCVCAQSCPTLCDLMILAFQAPLSMEFSRQEYWSGKLFPSPGIFPTQRSNPGLPHCGWILYFLNNQGNPRKLEWVAYLFCRGSYWPRDWTRVSCIAGRFFTSWATKYILNK